MTFSKRTKAGVQILRYVATWCLNRNRCVPSRKQQVSRQDWIRVSASMTTSPVAKQKDQPPSFRLLVSRRLPCLTGYVCWTSLDMIRPLRHHTMLVSCEEVLFGQGRGRTDLQWASRDTAARIPTKRRLHMSSYSCRFLLCDKCSAGFATELCVYPVADVLGGWIIASML